MIKQPSANEIREKLLKAAAGEVTREAVEDWALYYINNEDSVEINDLKAWHYLCSISVIAEQVLSNGKAEYIYSIDDIKDWTENP